MRIGNSLGQHFALVTLPDLSLGKAMSIHAVTLMFQLIWKEIQN